MEPFYPKVSVKAQLDVVDAKQSQQTFPWSPGTRKPFLLPFAQLPAGRSLNFYLPFSTGSSHRVLGDHGKPGQDPRDGEGT